MLPFRLPQHDDHRTDRQLLQVFAEDRDEMAFASLLRRHGAIVLAVCRRVLGNQQDSEDASQETFFALARKAGASKWQESVAGWLCKVARQLAQKARKRRLRRREVPGRDAEPATPFMGGESALSALVGAEEQERATQALQRCPDKGRESLQATLEAQGRNRAVAELARRWQRTRSHVYYLGERALEAIRKEMGVDKEDGCAC